MVTFTKIVKSAYSNAYDLKSPIQYSIGYCDYNGDLNKRWYIWYACRNPKSGKLERQTPIYISMRLKTIVARRSELKAIYQITEEFLKDGFNVFIPESAKSQPLNQSKKYTATEAIDFALSIKEKELRGGYADFKSRITQFKNYLIGNNFGNEPVNQINDVLIINYLNGILLNTSARNRNNTRIAISSLFSCLVKQKIIKKNPAEKIDILSAPPQRNKSYTSTQEEKILDTLAKTDQGRLLRLYIYFVSINLLRPIEVSRLCIKDIDVKDKTIKLQAKNKLVKTKILPELLLCELPDLSSYDQQAFLFGIDGIGQHWQANEKSRSQYYSDMFRKLIKTPMNLGKDYGFYSFRHTVIKKLLTALMQSGLSLYAAKCELMLITGHTTMKALEMYLRDIDAVLPEDYSHLLTNFKP